MIEIAYDDDGTDILGRVQVRSDFTYVLTLRSARVPAGVLLYYRMMSEQAGEYAKINFRYYLRPP